jgi:hypothetical protein
MTLNPHRSLFQMFRNLDPWASMHGTPEDVASFHVYRYEWIDRHDYEKPASEVLSGWSRAHEFCAALQERWLSVGWAGDGTITTIWLPLFCIEDIDPTHGLIVWHVKQLEDGTSWIASRVPLPFLGLECTPDATMDSLPDL